MKSNFFKLKIFLNFKVVLVFLLGTQILFAQKELNFFELKQKWEERIEKDIEDINLTKEEAQTRLSRERKMLERWKQLWRYRLGPNGEMTTASKEFSKLLSSNARNADKGSRSTCTSTYDDNINWTNLGPLNSNGSYGGSNNCTGYLPNKQNQGRLDAISVNPTNTQQILVGGFNGGIWRSTNGGTTWINTTDDEGYSLYGINSIKRHPANAEIVYATTTVGGGLWEATRSTYGMGLIVSTNGGSSWQPTGLIYSNYGAWNSQLGEIAIDPNSTTSNTIIYCVSNTEVFRWQGSHLANGTWTNIAASQPFGTWHNGPLWWGYVNNNDLVVNNSGVLFFTNYLGLFKYQGGTVSQVTSYTIPSPYNAYDPLCMHIQPVSRQHINIEINNQGHIVLLIAFSRRKYSNTNNKCISEDARFLYKSTDNGVTWSAPKLVNVFNMPANRFPMLAVSPGNSDVVYFESSSRCAVKSTNFGTTITAMGNSNNHVDIRYFQSVSGSGTNDNIYIATDGGISKTTNGQDWVDITGQGMSITNYYGCGITESNDKMIFAGAQDGSINYFNNGNWYETKPGGDNGDCLINPVNSNMIIQESQNSLCRGTLSGNDVTTDSYYSGACIPQGNDCVGWMNPLKWNGNSNNEFFFGLDFLKIGLTSGSTLTAVPTSLHSGKNVSSVEVSRNNPNVVYYSTDSYVWNGSAPTDDGIYKAVRTGSSWTVTNISSNLYGPVHGITGLSVPITDVAVDPNNENRIWITMAGFESGKKVYYSSNGGSSWSNITSTGLPNLPCTAIVYQEMSNDRIYVGTDNGIYYTDNSLSCWAKYGNNGPQCMVNDMEINQCSGKLVVATHGRGLWEAPLIINPEATIITGNTTWNKSRTIANNILVPTGATLNITGASTVINMAQNTKIMIAQGGRVNVTDATITNTCGKVWGSIEIWGNSALSQTFANQGALILNNATIEHGTEAVIVSKDGGTQFNGGIIQATNTKFFNNKRSVSFYKYDLQNNASFFTNCNFKTDANYRFGSLSLLAHLTMWAVKGINISGCNFETTNNFAWDATRVTGIGTVDANFTVTDYCSAGTNPCPGAIKSTFNGLHKAINAQWTTGTSTFNVYKSVFQNNVYGIISTGHNNFNIRANNFTVGKTSVGTSAVHEGVSIFAGTGFNIDQNTFTPTFTSTSPTTIGIRCTDTGTSDKEIYKNSFFKTGSGNNNVFYGNLANGINRNNNVGSQQFGLKYSCNTNTNNTLQGYDFAVTDVGISNAQGSLLSPARNTFSLGTSILNSDFQNAGGPINYYYRVGFTNENPIQIAGVTKFGTSSNTNYCYDRYGGIVALTLPDENSYDLVVEKVKAIDVKVKEASKNSDSKLVDQLNQELLDLNREKLWIERDVLQYHISNNDELNLIKWYIKIGDLSAKMSLIDLYLGRNEIENAESKILALLDEISKMESEDDQIINFINLKTLQINALKEKREININITEAERSFLQKLAQTDRGKGGYQARNILNFLGDNYFIEPVFPNSTEWRNEQENVKYQENSSLSAFPNPASQVVTFSYNIGELKPDGTQLKIVDFMGRTIQTLAILSTSGDVRWDCSFVPNGIYYYSIIKNEDELIKPKAVIVIK